MEYEAKLKDVLTKRKVVDGFRKQKSLGKAYKNAVNEAISAREDLKKWCVENNHALPDWMVSEDAELATLLESYQAKLSRLRELEDSGKYGYRALWGLQGGVKHHKSVVKQWCVQNLILFTPIEEKAT